MGCRVRSMYRTANVYIIPLIGGIHGSRPTKRNIFFMTIKLFLKNWKEEKDSAFFYAQVALFEKDDKKRQVFQKVSQIEEDHARFWEEKLRECNVEPTYIPSLRIRVFLSLIKTFGQSMLLAILERNKRAKIQLYFDQLEAFEHDALQQDVKNLFQIEKSHATVLNCLSGKDLSPFEGEGWHSGQTGIRDIIFGMNDGLLSTFSLIAGMAGGAASSATVLLAGMAGAIAGAISMAAGAFVSVRAEREVMEKQLEIERKEIHFMPEFEEQELSELYQLKGLSKEKADDVARTIMADKDVALDTMAKEELGFTPTEMANPFVAALYSGVAFIVGAAIPIIPFFFYGVELFRVAIITSLSGFFIIGACRTIVTGKHPVRSGLEMFIIGSSAATITYVIGRFISQYLH